jgi:hypothetical protein
VLAAAVDAPAGTHGLLLDAAARAAPAAALARALATGAIEREPTPLDLAAITDAYTRLRRALLALGFHRTGVS